MLVKPTNAQAINEYLEKAQGKSKVRRIRDYKHLDNIIFDAYYKYLPVSALIYNNTLEDSHCIIKVMPVVYKDYAYPFIGSLVEFTVNKDGVADLERVYRDDLTKSAYDCQWTLSAKTQKRMARTYSIDNRVKIILSSH